MTDELTIKQLETYKNTYDCFDGISSNEFDAICDELIKYKKIEEKFELVCPFDKKQKCPLDVRLKIESNSYIYTPKIAEIEKGKVVKRKVEGITKDGIVISFYVKKNIGYFTTPYVWTLPWWKYGTDWWLEEDESDRKVK